MLKFFIFLSLCIGIFKSDATLSTIKYDTDESIEPTEAVKSTDPVGSNLTTESTTQNHLPCPLEWTHFSELNKCLFATPTSFKWHDAEKYCTTQFSSHLLSVHGIADLDAASKLGTIYFWVGLYKDALDGTWKFTNNETVDNIPGGRPGLYDCSLASKTEVARGARCESEFFGICQLYANS